MTVTDQSLNHLAVVDCGEVPCDHPGYGRKIQTTNRLLLVASRSEMDAIREAFRE